MNGLLGDAQERGDLAVALALAEQQGQRGALVSGKLVDSAHGGSLCGREGRPSCDPTHPARRTVGYRGGAMATPGAEEMAAAIQGFDRLYGLELLSVSDTEVTGRVAVRDEVKQPAGLVHGGVYAAIAESLASLATHVAVAAGGEMAMGLSNSTSFLRPVTEGPSTRAAPAFTAAERPGCGTCSSPTTRVMRAP